MPKRTGTWIYLHVEKGYNTELGQGGVNVSGGQSSGSIARHFEKPKIRFSTTAHAVDTATEAKIRECFKTI